MQKTTTKVATEFEYECSVSLTGTRSHWLRLDMWLDELAISAFIRLIFQFLNFEYSPARAAQAWTQTEGAV